MKFINPLPYILTSADLYLTPVYILLIFLIARKWRKRYSDSPLKKYIYPAIFCRIIGCIFLALIFNYYYGYGDAFSYYTGASEIWNAFVHSPKIAFEIIFNNASNYSAEALVYAQHAASPLSSSHIAMFKISGFTGLFCFGSYLPIALVFSLLSFWGTWMIFLVFNEAFPNSRKYIAITTLFLPSVIVWSSGVLKEPLCMFGLGLCFYSINNILKKRRLVQNIISFLFGSIILFIIKDYILYCFVPGVCIWCYKAGIRRVSSSFAKLLIKGTIYLSFLMVFIFFIPAIQQDFNSYFLKAAKLQIAMTQINTDYNSGSGYTLPITDNSPSGLITSFFLSLNVSLFRPYAWECTSVLMVLNFIESFLTFLLIIIVILRTGIINIYRNLKNPLLLFSFIFSLLMAAIVGFISFNFGALIRYKIPFEPFFYTFLVILLLAKKTGKREASFA